MNWNPVIITAIICATIILLARTGGKNGKDN